MTAERYIEKYGKLHVLIRKSYQPYFNIDLSSVKVKLIERTDLIKVTIFTVADTIVVMRDTLNFPYKQESFEKDGKLWHRGNGALDLSLEAGIQVLGHEIKHCEQWRLIPRWKYWLWYLPGVIKGWIEGRRYAHKYIRWEQEAIKFQKTIKFSDAEKQLFKAIQ